MIIIKRIIIPDLNDIKNVTWLIPGFNPDYIREIILFNRDNMSCVAINSYNSKGILNFFPSDLQPILSDDEISYYCEKIISFTPGRRFIDDTEEKEEEERRNRKEKMIIQERRKIRRDRMRIMKEENRFIRKRDNQRIFKR